MIVSEKLKEQRKYLGYRTMEVCRDINMSQETLKSIEAGRVNPTFSELSKLAEYYKLSTEELLSDEPIHRLKIHWSK